MKFGMFLLMCDNSELLHVYYGKNTQDCESLCFGHCDEFILYDKYGDYKVNRFFSDTNYNGAFSDDTLIEVYITEK